jgi:hypothetical protein
MNQLEALFQSKIDSLEELILSYPFEDKTKYCEWLSQQYYLVENSTRYLALSASQVKTSNREEFRDWVHHLSEELDHDILILKDLQKLEYHVRDQIFPVTRAIVATQYYDIQNYGPNALLGYALMLEGLSCRVCETLANRVEAAHGKGTATYLRLHANVDMEHFPEGIKKIHSLDGEQAKIVAMNLNTMSVLYTNLLFDLQSNLKQASFIPATHQPEAIG